MTIRRISASDYLKEVADREHATVDLRTPAESRSEGLPGCIPLPVQELDAEGLQSSLARAGHGDVPVYLLCQSGKRADMAVDRLKGRTDCELVVIEGGVNALKQAGAVVVSQGKPVMSLERQVRVAAGGLTLAGTLLGIFMTPGWLLIPAFVGAGLVFAGLTDTCGMAMILARMPWNNRKEV